MPAIVPTVGRVVWYRPWVPRSIAGLDQPNDNLLAHMPHQPLTAIVAYVLNERCVTVSVCDIHGVWHGRELVYLWDGEGETPTGGPYCEWMPYQKGQAAKTEELEKRLTP